MKYISIEDLVDRENIETVIVSDEKYELLKTELIELIDAFNDGDINDEIMDLVDEKCKKYDAKYLRADCYICLEW